MICKMTAILLALALVFCCGSFLSAKTATSGSEIIIATVDVETPPEGALYKEAEAKLRNIPKDFNPDEAIKNGWQENQEMENVLSDNKEAIELFKRATMQRNDGFIFGKKPAALNAATELPKYLDALKLFKLLLLEARRHESKKQYSEAVSDYLAALRFMQHVSQQRFGIMMANIINVINTNTIYPCLRDAVKNNGFSRQQYQLLLDGLLSISRKQDFLEAAFNEEREFGRGTLRMIEPEAKKGATFEQLFSFGPKSSVNHKKYAARLNRMLDAEFFGEFYKQIDVKSEDIFDNLIVAARNNRPEPCEKKFADFRASLGSVEALEDSLLSAMGNSADSKESKLKIADIEAKIFLSVGIPQFTKIITRYHVFYNKFNTLTVAFAVKLYQMDNKVLPENLNQLVPKYLTIIPADTFNDFKPLAYAEEGNYFSISSKGAPKFEGDEKVQYDKGPIVFSLK
ncbi:MAG: hypothetical protein PHP17_02985 [Candidatus Omnitrophica bacterium]|nr:hypothetical protein [Candidatus Omnitrophota bacterium]